MRQLRGGPGLGMGVGVWDLTCGLGFGMGIGDSWGWDMRGWGVGCIIPYKLNMLHRTDSPNMLMNYFFVKFYDSSQINCLPSAVTSRIISDH